MPARRVLILAGTSEARDLAAQLHEKGVHAITSLAGVTQSPLLPPGEIRRGGFGGTEGLVDYLRHNGITHLIDATHPFASNMSAHGHDAARLLSIPLLRLERPAWPLRDRWLMVGSIDEAAQVLPSQARALITTGHRGLLSFLARKDISGVIRTIEPAATPMPPHWQLLLQRPPYTVDSEVALMQANHTSHLVTKNSGGSATAAKLDAAELLGVTVVMIGRPFKPPCTVVSDVSAAVDWLGG
ncbi:MAG: cobalt-precorrin-6A reductase [Proteobacteria bacterium]|nr:cobalt-precorrin-6A reductase [Pseudomonadota bacterium]